MLILINSLILYIILDLSGVSFFGADMVSPVRIDDKEKGIIIPAKGPTVVLMILC